MCSHLFDTLELACVSFPYLDGLIASALCSLGRRKVKVLLVGLFIALLGGLIGEECCGFRDHFM